MVSCSGAVANDPEVSPHHNGPLVAPWAVELISMVNMGLKLSRSLRRIKFAARNYHEIAADLLDAGIAEIGSNSPCAKATAAIAAQHSADGNDWGTLANDALMAAHHAGPFARCQWVARAAARSAHGAREGRSDDLAMTATWVARAHADRENAWHRIANIVCGSAPLEPHGGDNTPRNVPATRIAEPLAQPLALPSLGQRWHQGLAMVMRRYGFFALDVDHGSGSITSKLKVINSCFDDTSLSEALCTAVFVADPNDVRVFGLEGKKERCGSLLKQPQRHWLRKQRPLYRPLLDFVSFTGAGLTPLLQTDDGRTVVGWVGDNSRKLLVIGLDVVEELVRHTQGNPERVKFNGIKNLWGGGHEQPTFLYDGHIVSGYESEPWADKLGMLLAEALATAADVPLLCPLPRGLRGGVILTGDDDQAWLEKYEEQLGILGDFPITYFLLPHTNHTPETLARMPESVEFGVHIDALDAPDQYDARCAQQTAEVRQLVGDRPVHAIRNHGHLNRDYWGHLHAWETAGLTLDFNIRGLDGTCPTGSYLPFRVRQADGTWSSHASLFSTFSDSMFFLQKWSEKKQIKTIKRLADQIDRTIPGVMVFNFHPQNVSQVSRVHRAVMQVGRRKGWRAFGTESFRQWLESVDGVRMDEADGKLFLCSSAAVKDVALRWPGSATLSHLPTWQGKLKLATSVS